MLRIKDRIAYGNSVDLSPARDKTMDGKTSSGEAYVKPRVSHTETSDKKPYDQTFLKRSHFDLAHSTPTFMATKKETDTSPQPIHRLDNERLSFFKRSHFKIGNSEAPTNQKSHSQAQLPSYQCGPRQYPKESFAYQMRNGAKNLNEAKQPYNFVTHQQFSQKWLQPQ